MRPWALAVPVVVPPIAGAAAAAARPSRPVIPFPTMNPVRLATVQSLGENGRL